MSVELIREYWGYHHWANRRLFDVVAALGEPAAGREVGRQFSEPTLRAMLVHMYGADWFWLETWRGRPPAIVRGDPTYGLDIRALDDLRRRWDALEADQRGYLADLVEIDLWKPLDGTTPEGRSFTRPLGMLLLQDRKSTRLNSSHLVISYAVFCLTKKKTDLHQQSKTLKIEQTAKARIEIECR